jgi:ribulose-phosphate 3-epimerase
MDAEASAGRVRISTSIQSADQSRLAEEIAAAGTSDWIHVDAMDNHFVPRIFGGLGLVRSLAKSTGLPLDCHLLIEDPDRWAPAYAEAGAAGVTFHAEAARSPISTLRAVRSEGAEAGCALNPATPVDSCAPLIPELDTLLLLAVEPTAGGSEPLVASALRRLRRARELADTLNPRLRVQIDGAVDARTIGRFAEAGADIFTPGLSVFRSDRPADTVAELRELARRALDGRAAGRRSPTREDEAEL